ncbi:MAG: GntR family transcriptional regulator [Myxococcaceae bacterium]|nr:GntR family transcriptional regulator [Myxococcaceae bacterium]
MPLEAVKNRSLADQVFAQLATEIVGPRYEPGAALPSERELAEVFGVNRHVVREALKRLAQANLVKIAQGGHTRVLDYKRHAGLELLALFAEYASGQEQVIGYWFSVLEMRAAMAADVVRLCAQRASRELKQELVEISQKMEATSDVQEVYALEVRFWDRVLDGADNLAYRLAFNSLMKSAFRMGKAARELSVSEVRANGNRISLARAIADGDAERAETETRTQARIGLAALTHLFGHARPMSGSRPPAVTAATGGSSEARARSSDTLEPKLGTKLVRRAAKAKAPSGKS